VSPVVTGRDGWCDGDSVKPVEIDITSNVDLTHTNALIYSAQSFGADDDERWTLSLDHIYVDPKTKTDGCQGYIIMSTNLVFYQKA